MRDTNDFHYSNDIVPEVPSAYTLLGISETSSRAELKKAYDEELQRLSVIVPTNPDEERLLAHKKEELISVYEQSADISMTQRIQRQYKKQGSNTVRLNSFFPVGGIGLLSRLINWLFGSSGLCDSSCMNCFTSLDEGCCSCSLFGNDCCLSDTYGACISNTVCNWITKCDTCYEESQTCRLIDMGLVILAVMGWIISSIISGIRGEVSRKRYEAERKAAKQKLDDLNTAVKKRNELIREAIDCFNNIKIFQTDIRPAITFLSMLPEASERLVSMAERINQPNSFFTTISAEHEKLQNLISAVENENKAINQLADSIRDANMLSYFSDDEERYHSIMRAADEDIMKNYTYRNAVNYKPQW